MNPLILFLFFQDDSRINVPVHVDHSHTVHVYVPVHVRRIPVMHVYEQG